jgi:hypothetical protein
MATNQFYQSANHTEQNIDVPAVAQKLVDIEKTQQLAWQMLDECLAPEDMAALESDLQACPEARAAYLDVIQLDTELRDFFGKKAG